MSTLLVASAGGHLKQLRRLVPRIAGLEPPFVWVTYPTSQTDSLLRGERVVHGHTVESRDYPGVARNAWLAAGLMRRERFSRVITTGSAIALAFVPVARARGVPCHYIESAARAAGPSQTGRLLRRVPGVRLYTQYPSWADARWRYAGSVLDEFEPRPERLAPGPLRRVVVTVGTSEQYGFPRLVRRMAEILPAEAEVLWQTGATDVTGLGIDARAFVPADELDRAIAQADVVVTHAGTGTALSALEAGKAPVLVPRERAHGENVDDHQALISAELARRGLGFDERPGTLGPDVLAAAALHRVLRRPDPPPVRLAAD